MAYVGILGALLSCTSAAVQPLWGFLCDRYSCHRAFYLLTSVASPLVYLWIIRSHTVAELIVCALLSGMLINCMQNMGNGWVASLNAQGHHINYGASRSCGSLAFAVMAVALGKVIGRFGLYGLVAGMGLCGLACASFSFTIPRSAPAQRHNSQGEAPTFAEGLRVLLTQREYLVVVFSGFLAMFGVAGLSSYYTVHLANMGANAAIIGIGTFAYAMAEVPFMFLYERLRRRFSFHRLLAVSLFAHGLQCALVGLATSYGWAIGFMVLQGLAFGTLIPSIQQYAAQHIDPKYVSTAQLFSTAVCFSASMIFGNLAASALSRQYSLRITFLVMAVISWLGWGVYLLFRSYQRKNGSLQ